MRADGLVLSLLVIGTLPNFPVAANDLPFQLQRHTAMNATRDEALKVSPELHITRVLKYKMSPSARLTLKPGDHVRVFRETRKKREGPFLVIRIDGKTVWVNYGTGVKQFRPSQIVPFIQDGDSREI